MYGSTPIEVAWTAAPALVVVVLALVIARTLMEVNSDLDRPPPDAKPLRVSVIGHQWWWEYAYERDGDRNLSFIAANELYAEISAKNPRFKKVYDNWRPFRNEEVLWFRVCEGSFDNFMARMSAAEKL